MATKSLYEQIVDRFTEKLRRKESMDNDIVDSLKAALVSGKIKKADILKALKKEEKYENSGT
jgi:predicted RNase H-like nuclease